MVVFKGSKLCFQSFYQVVPLLELLNDHHFWSCLGDPILSFLRVTEFAAWGLGVFQCFTRITEKQKARKTFILRAFVLN